MEFISKKKYDNKKNKTLKDSFLHAYEGIVYAMMKERNMHIHITMALLVIVFGIILELSYVEWLISLILIALVISLELINTSIEAVVDLVTTNDSALAKIAKDSAAGAVLFTSIIAAFIGLVIFLPKVINFIINIGG